LTTRQDSFRAAVINAFAPFFNREFYAASDPSAGT
jgi:non-canonical (house-cleaning) NTP pyrophosphatase